MQPLPPDNTRVHLSPPAMVGNAENPCSPGNKVLVDGSESQVVTCIEGRRGYSHRMLSRAIEPGITVMRSFLSARCLLRATTFLGERMKSLLQGIG